ncbi:unnamed protein product [Paramecium pentaurelia]|uniref:Insulin-like growth factor binding protein, N-terminal n=1 Tax=Paramecium pentaurelia TaxID=43138 RepID=A0A8S1XUT3_9CILI|nr:unnamed protein product [Paramecium pentaurelia]
MAFSEWRLISSDFYQEQIDTTSNWETLKSCTNDLTNTHSINQCQTNRLDFIRLREDAERIKKEFNYPHFQLRIITDVIYIRSKYGEESHFNIQIKDSTQVTKLFTRQYQESSLQEYDNVCRQRCSGNCGSLNEDKIEIMTHIINAIDHNNPLFNIQYCFQPQNQYMHIGLRNILIYVNSCHISCASCSGNTKNDFLTCYYGSQEGGSCQCEESNKYIHLLKGCVFECPRDYYLADESNYCQFDKRIKSKFIYFPHSQIDNANLIPYDPWIYVPDPFHINNSNKIFSCQGEDQVGKFSYYESMKLRLPQHEGLNYLRIRVSFYFFGWQTDSVLSVIVDKYSQMRIEKTLNNYTVYNGRLNKFESSSCSGEEYDYLRIETVLKTYTTTPVIQFQAIQKQYNEYWSFKNVTIDYGLCQSNCTKCKSFSKCLICESNYKLYRGSCVLQCPMYSQVNNDECIDYEDLIDNSRYLIKAFYDMNTTFEEVSKVVDNFTDLNDIIQQSFTGAFYSFVPEKSVLGGVLVWSKGKFKKTFTSLKPHYKVSIRMNITYGDNNNGWFQLKLDSQEQNKIYNPKTGTKNLVGDQKDETTILIDTHLLHSSDQLDIVLSANTNEPQLDEAFIYISEYFVVVHYCVPFCTSCTGPLIDDCTSSYSGQNSINYCSINEYLEFNSDTQIYICKQCNQLGCIECQSASVCKRCEFSDQKQFYLDQGECICYPSAYLQSNECIKCNRYCESYQCYTCNSDFHRSVNNYQCQCVIGYYDDGYNLECLPLCGDELIVEGEDCDDGKNNPFDGCDHCRFKCQDECLNCHQGKCYQCKDGYTYDQTTYKCLTTCGDKIIQGNEQCDDGNDNIQDGCHYCKLICDINCINCINGNCLKCDEINGWYLNNFNHCQYICGDGIITKQYKQCDDSNQYPFDLCDNCNLSCSDHCISCENGICQNCETGFIYHNQIKKCLSICGDSIIVGNEQCEDSSSDIMNSCQYCNFKCNSKCLLCDFNECLQCELGYYLRNNMCEESCGDGLIVSNEQCDDLIQSIDSNCLSCRYNCGYGCIICTNGICELCEFGYIREQYRCKPICGDQIIVYPEVCDDANLEPYDGCHFCQYSCIPQCLKCILGVCSEMQQLIIDEQYQVDNKYNCSDYCTQCQDQNICLMCEQYFQLSNSFCIPICGDGIIIPGLEQCEDGNDIPFDGCYQCQYQCSYGCIECEQFNQCIKCDDDQFILDIQTNKCLINHKLNNIIETDNSILFIDQITQIRYM